eukprot:2526885-Rhodomonas_salina.1
MALQRNVDIVLCVLSHWSKVKRKKKLLGRSMGFWGVWQHMATKHETMLRRVLLLTAVAVETTAFQTGMMTVIGRGVQSRVQAPLFRGLRPRGIAATRMESGLGDRKDTSAIVKLDTIPIPRGMKIVCDGRNMCVLEEEDDSEATRTRLNFWVPRLLILGCCMIYGSNFAFGYRSPPHSLCGVQL